MATMRIEELIELNADRVLALKLGGATYREIGRALQRSGSTIRRWCGSPGFKLFMARRLSDLERVPELESRVADLTACVSAIARACSGLRRPRKPAAEAQASP